MHPGDPGALTDPDLTMPIQGVTQARPRCFVAMAFDHPDTDRVYDRLIRPVLRRNGIAAVIINRRHSNDDLNNQIITQLGSCNLCITDLTYARPSVYFEAGYAERAVPVIYTVRTDHLRSGQPDDRRVHFDLQMKPLLRWKGDRDSGFQVRLERRIRATFLRTWRRNAARDARQARQRAAFSSLSPAQRQAAMKRILLNQLRRVGFKSWIAGPGSRLAEHAAFDDILVARKCVGRTLTVATVFVGPSVVGRQLKRLGYLTVSWAFPHDIEEGGSPTVEVHNLVAALRPIPRHRIETALPHLVSTQTPGHYRGQEVVLDARPGRRGTAFAATMSFISDPKAEPELRLMVRDLVRHVFEGGHGKR